jgi:hypothetical protein
MTRAPNTSGFREAELSGESEKKNAAMLRAARYQSIANGTSRARGARRNRRIVSGLRCIGFFGAVGYRK